MSVSLAVDKVQAVSLRIVNPAVGPWLVLADLDLPSSAPVPSGKVTVTIDREQLRGTVDPKGSGRFGEKAKLRIIAGAGAWESEVSAQDFHNDAGVKSSLVIGATATAIGESVIEPNPIDLGSAYFERKKGRASRVLDGRIWYHDADGVTHVVDARPTSKPSKDVDVLAWDPDTRTAMLSADSVVWPGTVLTDPRFDTATIRDVEQTFSAAGARATAYCAATEGSRLATAFETMIEEFGHLAELRAYEYRIVKQNVDGRVYLQAVRKNAGVPDMLPVPVWPGMAGDSADYDATLGQSVHVVFLEGDPRRPRVVAFDGQLPLVRRVFAKNKVRLGDANAVPLAKASVVASLISKLKDFATASKVSADATLASTALQLESDLTALASPATTKVEGT